MSIQCISYRCICILNQPNAQYQTQVNNKDNVSTIYMQVQYTGGCDTQHSSSMGTRSTLDLELH